MMLDGPRRPPASGGAARHLVVLLHGYGANGDDLIGLAAAFAPALPDAAFVAPDAPQAIPGYPMGLQWFPLTRIGPREIAEGAAAAAPAVNAFLDAELARHGLADAALALVGFSQGTMMALQVGLRRMRSPAGILGYSGVLPPSDQPITAKPPVLLVHGDRDEIVPVAALPAAAAALADVGVPVETHIVRGLGHGIDDAGLRLGVAFLRRVLR